LVTLLYDPLSNISICSLLSSLSACLPRIVPPMNPHKCFFLIHPGLVHNDHFTTLNFSSRPPLHLSSGLLQSPSYLFPSLFLFSYHKNVDVGQDVCLSTGPPFRCWYLSRLLHMAFFHASATLKGLHSGFKCLVKNDLNLLGIWSFRCIHTLKPHSPPFTPHIDFQ